MAHRVTPFAIGAVVSFHCVPVSPWAAAAAKSLQSGQFTSNTYQYWFMIADNSRFAAALFIIKSAVWLNESTSVCPLTSSGRRVRDIDIIVSFLVYKRNMTSFRLIDRNKIEWNVQFIHRLQLAHDWSLLAC